MTLTHYKLNFEKLCATYKLGRLNYAYERTQGR